MKKLLTAVLSLTLLVGLTGCGGSDKKDVTTVKVGVVGEYNAQWDTVNKLLEKDNIKVELKKFTDYAAPNRALNDGEIDLNAFQTKSYLAKSVEDFKYDIEAIGDTIVAPLAIYNNKDKVSKIEDIKDGAIIGIPSDQINGGRALKLLEKAGLIECDPAKKDVPSKADITKYNKKIEIKEAESATLAKLLPDMDAAVINGGNAITAGLNPKDDSIFIEDVNLETAGDIVNVIVARTKDKDNEVYKKVVDAYHSAEAKKTIDDTYKGAFICAW